ncbi:nuclear receptor coactivator 6 isoform X2 [Uranotaenia lowii]|uniref:nuclear receptor coactivator 6 isoform X2 n=1 Tax=Uranotaenia lowii TaxID=190385 RepID=UPI00247B26C4|nr:nuclear receptor coactivator 6 isoform X2 [Uranotaenia lowii]
MKQLILFAAVLITGVLSQGFLQPPPFRPPNIKAQRRQLTQQQQNHIFSDIQQHQHRFNLHANRPPSNVIIQPSIQLPLPQQQLNQRPFVNTNNPFQSNPPPPPLPPFNNKQLPPQVPPQNFRPPPSGRQPPHNGFGAQVNRFYIQQHHTQTSFIPNFLRILQQETRIPPPSLSLQQQQPRPVPNTLQPPLQQQLVHQQPPFFNGPQLNNQPFISGSFPPSDNAPFGVPRIPDPRPITSSVQNPFLQPPTFSAPQAPIPSQVRFPSNTPTAQAQALFQAAPIQQQFPSVQTIVQQPFDNHIRSEVLPLAQQPLQTPNFNPFANTVPQQPAFNNFAPVQQSLPVFVGPQPLNSQPGVFPQIQPAATSQPLVQQPPQQQQSFPVQNQPQLNFQQQQELEKRLKEESARIRELQEKQKVIQKHEQFLQKQYQKQQAKVQQLHEDFLKKQQKLINQQQQDYETIRKTPTVSSNIQQNEPAYGDRIVSDKTTTASFKRQNPTTAASITVSTTTEPHLAVIPLKHNNGKKEYTTITKTDLDSLLQSNRQNLLQSIRAEVTKPTKARTTKVKSTKALGREDLLKQLKLALAEQGPQDLGGKNFSSTDLVLPNGEKVQVIRTTDPEIIKRANANSEAVLTQQLDSPTTAKALSFEDIAKSGILPPGADFELIKQSEDGQVQEVAKIPPQKKVTFVYLEEQDDGSYKVQGVKGSNDKDTKTSGTEVDTILKRIKNGEIQLPPPSNKVVNAPILLEGPTTSTTTPRIVPVQKASSVTIIPHSTPIENHRTTNYVADHTIPRTVSSPVTSNYVSTASPSSPSSITAFPHSTYYGSTIPQTSTVVSTPSPITNFFSSEKSTNLFTGISSTYPTSTPPAPTVIPFSGSSTVQYSTRSENYNSPSTIAQQTASSNIFTQHATGKFDVVIPTVPTPDNSLTTQNLFKQTQLQQSKQSLPLIQHTTPRESLQQSQSQQQQTTSTNELPAILKKSGLFAMAKYLRQSGLDTILNETGPYTIFVPTDKAFRSLLVQLGGPEKAEEKFKNNPRLLSGLLLHHVIPGSFEIGTLQDEMTGVSLAGTQLRVNQYNMHDSEWNDVKVTTINGAMVVPDKQDIIIPQGIAHGVDRVMFPLPVGDILQTLQSDRERRFTHFLRALYASGMSDTLQNKGIKTYTVFAPTDVAFSHLSTDELNKLVTDKEQAEELVKKHVVPGTLFTAGMRFYQVKDAMAEGKTVTLQKSGGKIKINDGFLLTSNIPSTNGVIHAVDALL